MTLLGREVECRALDALIDSARHGLGGTLVIRGEAGIGKTALIDHAVATAQDFLIVRFTGIEHETELGFAALHRLLTPILHQIDRLPAPQRDALNSALGLAPGPPANHFLVGLGVISLAANAARARERLLCVIDDAQWADRESMAALAFWGRRLHADGIALIFGERDGSESNSPLDTFAVLEVGGLPDESARQLLASEAGCGVDREVADRIVTETRGNPLALVEFAKDLRPDQLIGAAADLQPLPLSRRLEERFARQVRSLPIDTQMFLLLAAADSTADTAFLLRAASIFGVKAKAAEAAEACGMILLGPEIAFRHPLIRSAVYSRARPADRRAAHSALAAATDPADDAERHAWHLAAASITRDEPIAAQLERCAAHASDRGSHNAAVALLSRSAELTPQVEHAARRRVAAAEAALNAGSPLQAHALISLATPALRKQIDHAEAERVDGNAWMREGNVALAAPILLSAALGLMPSDPRLGRQTLLEAIEAVFTLGGGADADLIAAVLAAANAAPPGEGTIVDLLLDAFGTYLDAGFVAAAPRFRAAVSAMADPEVPPDQLIRWVHFASYATRALWDDATHALLMRRLAQATRERGDLTWLSIALRECATAAVWSGRFDTAEMDLADATDLSAAAGEDQLSTEIMGLESAAIRGRDAETRAKADAVIRTAKELGWGASALSAHHALLVLDLGEGHYLDALQHAIATMRGRVGCGHQVVADVVEAATRAGDRATAQAAVDRLAERAPASGTPWAMGLLARCRALLAGDDAEVLHKDAIELLGSTRMVVELARAHLLYGEWLRRQKRKIDARDQLRIAHDMFATMGAEAFARRARDELLATGERVRKRTVDTSFDLTAQEAHVAQLAAAGGTNAEIAAQLFISANTVEYHLRKVFRKLSVTSRRQLKGALTGRI